MNLGQLPPDLQRFVSAYKRFGYATRTQLISDALKFLQEAKAREQRQLLREELLTEYAGVSPEKVWDEVDGEDFK